HVDQRLPRGGSPLAVALVTGRDEQTQAGQSATQAVRRIGRGRGRTHGATAGSAPPMANSAPVWEAVAPSESTLARGDASLIEDAFGEPGPAGEKGNSLSGSGEISSGQSARAYRAHPAERQPRPRASPSCTSGSPARRSAVTPQPLVAYG